MSERDVGSGAGNGRTALSPSEAFSLLSNDTRLAVLTVLWEADDSLRFTDLAERADITDTGNLNYHLGQLDGRFIRREDGRYGLTYPGRQVMTLVMTGDITDQPALEPTRLDLRCPYCEAEVILVHYGDRLRVLCTGCEGTYRTKRPELPVEGLPETGTVTALMFPAVGVRDRDPEPLLEAGLARTASRWRDVCDGFCPDCGGTVAPTAVVCPDHESDGFCAACGSRFAVTRPVTCDTCGREIAAQLALSAVTDPTAVAFFDDHGVDLLDPTWETARHLLQGEERVHSTEPLEAEVVWTEDGESLHMRVGAVGEVLETTSDGRQ
jgi:hypothetical protein